VFPAGFFKRPMVIFTVSLFILGIFIPMAIPGSLFDSWNTSGDTWVKRGWETGINFDTPNIIGAMKSNADSEIFTITGKIRLDSATGAIFSNYRYALYVDGESTPTQRFPSDGSWQNPGSAIIMDGSWHYFQPWTTNVKTDGDLRLKVVMELDYYDYLQHWIYSNADSSEFPIPWDGAQVLTGMGAIYLPTSEIAKSPFEAGESVNVFVKTGFTGGEGWTVMVRPPADRTDIDQTPITIKTLGDNLETYISVTVGNDWFKVGSNNQWKVELWNQYFERNYDEILTIDDRERAPIITDISWVNNDDSFTYTVTVEETYNTLSFINVDAWYSYGGGTTMPGSGDTESWILQDVHYPVTGGTATFTAYPKSNIQGLIVVKIIAYDIDGRPSSPGYESFSVSNNGTVPEDPPIEQPFVWTTLAVILSAILILGIVAIMWFAPVPMNIKIILVMIIGIAGAILVWLFGTLQVGG